MNTLPIPYVSQILPGALAHNNDCGAASTLMVLKAYNVALDKTVDKIYDLIQPAGDVPLSATGMMNLLASFKVTNEWRSDMPLKDLFDVLSRKMPVILLIHYAALVKAGLTEKTSFLGAHFAVATGIDIAYVYIHDPYRTFGGENVPIPQDIFMQTWGQSYADGNPNFSAIVMKLAIKDLSVPAPAPTGTKYMFWYSGGVLVNGVNVSKGPGPTVIYGLAGTIWKATNPYIFIIQTVGDWGLLADKSGWVFLPYFKIA
jgi:hypothetical protein